MSSEFDRPEEESESEATACRYTSYDEKGIVEGDVPATGAGAVGLEREVWNALSEVDDPEMPVSVVDLGLIYGVNVDESAGTATVEMTLTYTGCPARDMLLGDVEAAVADVEGVEKSDITLVWSPGWTVDMVTEDGREALREFGLSI